MYSKVYPKVVIYNNASDCLCDVQGNCDIDIGMPHNHRHEAHVTRKIGQQYKPKGDFSLGVSKVYPSGLPLIIVNVFCLIVTRTY